MNIVTVFTVTEPHACKYSGGDHQREDALSDNTDKEQENQQKAGVKLLIQSHNHKAGN